MIINGVDVSNLKHPEHGTPAKVAPLVKGRVVHIDADFLAYMVSYAEDTSILQMQENCDTMIEKMRLMSGAEKTMLHLTPKGSDKGDRYNIALQKEYQGNRKDKPKPKFLHMIREYMHKERGAVLCVDCEADDSMATYQYNAIKEGKQHLSVIATKDKDLTMVPGLQVNWDTGEMTDTKDDPFGWITLDTSKTTKKVRGRGWKYFWAQLLMGDGADNIQGIPKVIHDDYTGGKLKSCGPVLTYDIISPVRNNSEAFTLVKQLFKDTGKALPYTNWRDGTPVNWKDVLVSEMKLLWMRRTKDQNDVLHWLKETT